MTHEFKVGDLVKIFKRTFGYPTRFRFIVKAVDSMKIQEDDGSWHDASKFTLVTPAPIEFGVGEWKMRNGEKAVVTSCRSLLSWSLVGVVASDSSAQRWLITGNYFGAGTHEYDLISPWVELTTQKDQEMGGGPVKTTTVTRTRRNIVYGNYEGLCVSKDGVIINFPIPYDAIRLRSAAATLIQIADALDANEMQIKDVD